MDRDNFRKTHYRNPPPPPLLSKLIGNETKTKTDKESDSEKVIVPRATNLTSAENLEKLKAEADHLRAKLSHLENVVVQEKNQKIDRLLHKLTSMRDEIDKTKSDKRLAEEKCVEVICQLNEAEVALISARKKNGSLSSSLEAKEKLFQEEVKFYEVQLEEKRKVTSQLKRELGNAAEKKYREEIQSHHFKPFDLDAELMKEKNISSELKAELEKSKENHRKELLSAETKKKVITEALKTKLRKQEEQLAKEKRTLLELELKASSAEERFQEKESELIKAKGANQKLIAEYSQVIKLLYQCQNDLDKCEEEKAVIRGNAKKEALELVHVNVEHQKEIHQLKSRLKELESGNPNPLDFQSTPEHTQKLVHSTENKAQRAITHPIAYNLNVEQPLVHNSTENRWIMKGPEEVHATDDNDEEKQKRRRICTSTFDLACPLKRSLQGREVAVESSSKSLKHGYVKLGSVEEKEKANFQVRP